MSGYHAEAVPGQKALTFVFPCLNEEGTLETCVTAVRNTLAPLGADFEIVVADNGSKDRSREIALGLGCRVVAVAERGYGAALRGGIEAALGKYVMFADCDNTYVYSDALRLFEAAKTDNAGMAIASRMTGDIETGAMPALHRHLGTPVLTTLINVLFGGKLSDCNSGFRCVEKGEYLKWNIRSSGMEFASELLIKALKARTRMVEIKSGLRCGPPDRVAHLRTWRDGMRHLLFILSEKPFLFEALGLLSMLPALVLQIAAWLTGPTRFLGMNVFDLHTQAVLLLIGIIGVQFYVFGCSLYLSSGDRPLGITRWLIRLDEGVLFFLLLAVLAASVLSVVALFVAWAAGGYGGIHQANTLILEVHLLGTVGMAAFGLLSVHTLKKAFASAPKGRA